MFIHMSIHMSIHMPLHVHMAVYMSNHMCMSLRNTCTHAHVYAQVVAWVFVANATIMLLLVFLRMTWHQLQVLRGRGSWNCPVAAECDMTKLKTEPTSEDSVASDLELAV